MIIMNTFIKSLLISTALLCTNAFADSPLRYFGQQENGYVGSMPYGNNSQAAHYQDVGDTKIYYEVYGTGKPIVVLHGGLVGSTAEMGQFIDSLSQHYRVIAGLRAMSDFEYEFQMALMNRQLAPEIETFFIVTDPKYSYLSSSVIRDIFQFGGTVHDMVPPGVFRRLRERFPPVTHESVPRKNGHA